MLAATRPSSAAVSAGGWLFARRGWLPVPLLLVMFVSAPRYWAPGLLLIAVGEGLRVLAVGYIGLPSRTRAHGVGPLVRLGPYAWLRNPLYVGNSVIFVGLGVIFWPWGIGLLPLFAGYYGLIVRWEEANLTAILGAPYVAYLADVPRWCPRRPAPGGPGGAWSAAVAVRSERSTFLALAIVLLAAFGRGAWA